MKKIKITENIDLSLLETVKLTGPVVLMLKD